MAADPQTTALPAMLGDALTVPIVQTSTAERTGCIVIDGVEIPLALTSLNDFRKWAVSDAFPERGRIDYLAGRIEVDMSPENLFSHGALKSEMAIVIGLRIKRFRLGHVFVDRARISSPTANLSAEPDIVFVSKQSIAERRLITIPYVNDPNEFIEFEGGPDLVVEIVSKSSVTKDTTRLPKLYWQAGVREFWLADARGESVRFQIYSHGKNGFEPMPIDADGFQQSRVLNCAYRIERDRDENGHFVYSLIEREIAN